MRRPRTPRSTRRSGRRRPRSPTAAYRATAPVPAGTPRPADGSASRTPTSYAWLVRPVHDTANASASATAPVTPMASGQAASKRLDHRLQRLDRQGREHDAARRRAHGGPDHGPRCVPDQQVGRRCRVAYLAVPATAYVRDDHAVEDRVGVQEVTGGGEKRARVGCGLALHGPEHGPVRRIRSTTFPSAGASADAGDRGVHRLGQALVQAPDTGPVDLHLDDPEAARPRQRRP